MPISEYYVDPSLGSDTGDGTVGTPWGRASGSVIQYALDTGITRDATNGDRINVRDAADDVLGAAIDVTGTYGTPTTAAPLAIQGYTTATNDGGIGGIDANAGSGVFAANALDFIILADLHMHNSGTATVVELDGACYIINCEVNNSTSGSGIDLNGFNGVINCYVHDVDDYCINVGVSCYVYGNYVANDGNNMIAGIRAISNDCQILHNVVNLDGTPGAGIGIVYRGRHLLLNNTVFSNAGTGSGFFQGGSVSTQNVLINNVVQGFSGVGGVGYEASADDSFAVATNNVSENNATDESLGGAAQHVIGTAIDNDPAGGTVFENAASADFRMLAAHDLQTYILTFRGASSTTFSLDRGAARHTDPTNAPGRGSMRGGML